MFIKAYASGGSGAGAYNRAQAAQLARETGVSQREAMRAIRANAGGRAPFQPAAGRRSTPAGARRATMRNLG